MDESSQQCWRGRAEGAWSLSRPAPSASPSLGAGEGQGCQSSGRPHVHGDVWLQEASPPSAYVQKGVAGGLSHGSSLVAQQMTVVSLHPISKPMFPSMPACSVMSDSLQFHGL